VDDSQSKLLDRSQLDTKIRIVLHTQAATLTATSDKDCGLVDQNNNTRARKQRKLGVLRRNFYNAASSVHKTTFLDSSRKKEKELTRQQKKPQIIA
jgi:hypothetical protein